MPRLLYATFSSFMRKVNRLGPIAAASMLLTGLFITLIGAADILYGDPACFGRRIPTEGLLAWVLGCTIVIAGLRIAGRQPSRQRIAIAILAVGILQVLYG